MTPLDRQSVILLSKLLILILLIDRLLAILPGLALGERRFHPHTRTAWQASPFGFCRSASANRESGRKRTPDREFDPEDLPVSWEWRDRADLFLVVDDCVGSRFNSFLQLGIATGGEIGRSPLGPALPGFGFFDRATPPRFGGERRLPKGKSEDQKWATGPILPDEGNPKWKSRPNRTVTRDRRIQWHNSRNMISAKHIRRIYNILSHPHYHRWDLWRGGCNICQRPTIFLCIRPEDRWIRYCLWCRSTPKYRALYRVLTNHLGPDLRVLLDGGARVYELTGASPISRRCSNYPGYACSVHWSDKPFGVEMRPRVWNQDLQRLTFPDSSFDVVISSETMEHVRRPWIGFGEIQRVLKTGGVHCFTIPYSPGRSTRSRVDTSGATDVHILPKVYHEDPHCRTDSLVFTDFGNDLPRLLRPIGFETQEHLILDDASDTRDDLRPMRVFLSVKR